MYKVKVHTKEGTVQEFEAQSASKAIQEAERLCPGYVKVIAWSDTAYMEFSHRRPT